MKISRRDFLRLLGITGVALGGASPTWAVPDEWVDKIYEGPLKESWKVSTCLQCTGGCGIKIRLIDGIPVRISGNPLSPVNRGTVCPMGEAGLELLYNPDRITKPLIRKGKRGESKFESVSWSDGLKKLSGAIQQATKGKKGDFAFLLGDRNTVTTNLVSEFVKSLGSNNLFLARDRSVNELGLMAATGNASSLSFDIEKSDYLLTFGTNLLEETPSPIYFNRIYGDMKGKRNRSGLKMVHVSPIASQAGINATKWVRIKPGTMGVLALGIAYVLIRDKNYDKNFVSLYGEKFEGSPDSFVKMVTTDYYPDRVAKVTGIPAKMVIQIAREFGSAKAPIALSGGVADASETALFTQWAAQCLNALGGSFSVKGLWREVPSFSWNRKRETSFHPNSSKMVEGAEGKKASSIPSSWVTEQIPAIFGGSAKESLSLMMIAQTNPLYHASNRKEWVELLEKIPTVVQFASILDDTSPFADVIFPISTYLEGWDFSLPSRDIPFAQAGLVQPIVKPFRGSRSLGDAIIQLTRAGIGSVAISGAADFEGYIRGVAKKIFSSGKGTPYFEGVSLSFLEELRKRGWQVYSYPAFKDFWKLLTEKGGWWLPDGYSSAQWYRKERFSFMTGKGLTALIEKRGKSSGESGGKEIKEAPHLWIEKAILTPEKEDAFVLVPFKTLFNISGDGASQPLLQELFGLHQRRYWQTWAEMNPERAEKLELTDGDRIKVVSDRGSIILSVKVVPTVSPETLAVPVGQGHKGLGKYGDKVGINPLDVIDHRIDRLSWQNSWQSTQVRVEKINS